MRAKRQQISAANQVKSQPFFIQRKVDFANAKKKSNPFFSAHPKAEINKPGDSLEREADSVAQQATNSSLEKESNSSDIISSLGEKMGADFSGVKIHNNLQANAKADAINAKAFTHKNEIFFNKNQYNPSSIEGKKLLAHELTHTIQQGAVPVTAENKTMQGASKNAVQRDEFEDHDVSGSGSDYVRQSINGLRAAGLAAQGHLNAYGLEVRNAISHFQTYANTRLTAIGEDIPGAGFMDSIISIALSAVPIPGAGALMRVVGEALRDAIISEVRSKLTSAAQLVTASRDTNDLRNAVLRIGSETTDIATSVRDRAMRAFNETVDEIIIKLNNGDTLTSDESEIAGMFYDAPSANVNQYLQDYFGIPMGSSLRAVQLGIYGNLVRAFERETFQVTRSTRESIYWTTMATGRDSGTDTYANHMADRAVSRRSEAMGGN